MQKTLTTTALGLLAVMGLAGAASAEIVLGASLWRLRKMSARN